MKIFLNKTYGIKPGNVSQSNTVFFHNEYNDRYEGQINTALGPISVYMAKINTLVFSLNYNIFMGNLINVEKINVCDCGGLIVYKSLSSEYHSRWCGVNEPV